MSRSGVVGLALAGEMPRPLAVVTKCLKSDLKSRGHLRTISDSKCSHKVVPDTLAALISL